MKIRTWAPILFTVIVLSPILAHADNGPYVIPLLGGRWATYTISVKIPAEPAWAHQGMADMLTVWNQAQDWFLAKYFSNGHKYTFIEQQQNAKVTLIYQQIGINCGTLANAAGCTRNFGSTIIQSSRVTLNIMALGRYVVFAHELGHVLGLEHTNATLESTTTSAGGTITIWNADLMNINGLEQANVPSTLDLYAVHLLAENSAPSSGLVTLPNSIPYMNVPEAAIPEFPLSGLILAVTFCAVSFLSVSGRVGRRGRLREL